MRVIDKGQLQSLVKSGITVARISEQTGWSKNTIYEAMRKMGLHTVRAQRKKEVKEPEYKKFNGEKICPECGKRFYVVEQDTWAYRPRKGKDKRLRCSWGCLRKTKTAGGEKR